MTKVVREREGSALRERRSRKRGEKYEGAGLWRYVLEREVPKSGLR
jgi:hypothetical protein